MVYSTEVEGNVFRLMYIIFISLLRQNFFSLSGFGFCQMTVIKVLLTVIIIYDSDRYDFFRCYAFLSPCHVKVLIHFKNK